jgi:DNA primase
MGAVEEVKERLDIVEVVSTYTPLQKSGRNFKALCPFHAEKTPSFYVFPDSQRWHCFGACGEGGDVFSFVMRQEGWDFRTTLEELAQQAGVELRPLSPAQVRQAEESQRLREALLEAATFYHRLLLHAPQAEEARDYVARRGLARETVEQFKLGYSLPSWDSLRSHLLQAGFSVEEMVQAGLLVEKEGGSTYDRFRDRLMIPIRDVRDRFIGFGARTLEPGGIPKYMNSPQTPLFDKSRTLYGLDVARQTIRDENQVVIVEGYMDVMRAHQEGFKNVVAQMGTSLTEHQVRLLQRYCRRFVLALDPDAAGVQATLRGLEVARDTLARESEPVFNPHGLVGYEGRLGAEIRILSLPPGQDPDDLIGEDPERWKELVEQALPVVEFTFQRLVAQADLEDAKDRARVVERMLPLLRDVADPIERETYAQHIARTLRVQESTLLARLHRAERRSARVQTDQATTAAALGTVRTRALSDLEEFCLSLLFHHSWLMDPIRHVFQVLSLPMLRPGDFQDAVNRALFEVWQGLLQQGETPTFEQLQKHVPTPLLERLDELQTPVEDTDRDQITREGIMAVLRLRQRNLKQSEMELRLLTRQAQEEDLTEAQRYGKACLDYAQTILLIQQALNKRWADMDWVMAKDGE